MKTIAVIIPADLVTNPFLFSSCFFLKTKKQESGFQQVRGLVTRTISGFCLWRVALFFKVMANSIDFYERILLHLIPVRIIVPWPNVMLLI